MQPPPGFRILYQYMVPPNQQPTPARYQYPPHFANQMYGFTPHYNPPLPQIVNLFTQAFQQPLAQVPTTTKGGHTVKGYEAPPQPPPEHQPKGKERARDKP